MGSFLASCLVGILMGGWWRLITRKQLCEMGPTPYRYGDMLASLVFDVAVNWGCCFLIVDACTACLHIDITMFCMLLPAVVYLFWRRCLQSWQKPAESFHTTISTIRHKQVPRVSIPPHGMEGSLWFIIWNKSSMVSTHVHTFHVLCWISDSCGRLQGFPSRTGWCSFRSS